MQRLVFGVMEEERCVEAEWFLQGEITFSPE
jgi:hypothetical protein